MGAVDGVLTMECFITFMTGFILGECGVDCTKVCVIHEFEHDEDLDIFVTSTPEEAKKEISSHP